VYAVDMGNSVGTGVRKISVSTGVVTSLGTAASPVFNRPTDIALDSSDNVYVADWTNSLVRKIDVTTGSVTKLGTSASPAFRNPVGLAVDSSGNVYVADWTNSLVRKIDVTT
jgi:sugar lactone lactonase YvrE